MFISWIIGLIRRAALERAGRQNRNRNHESARREIEALPPHMARDLGWRVYRD